MSVPLPALYVPGPALWAWGLWNRALLPGAAQPRPAARHYGKLLTPILNKHDTNLGRFPQPLLNVPLLGQLASISPAPALTKGLLVPGHLAWQLGPFYQYRSIPISKFSYDIYFPLALDFLCMSLGGLGVLGSLLYPGDVQQNQC